MEQMAGAMNCCFQMMQTMLNQRLQQPQPQQQQHQQPAFYDLPFPPMNMQGLSPNFHHGNHVVQHYDMPNNYASDSRGQKME